MVDSIHFSPIAKPQSKQPQKPAAQAAAPQVAASNDNLKRSALNNETDALALLNEMAAPSAMPEDPAAQKAWLKDGFARLLKASAAEEVIRKAWMDGKVSGSAITQAGKMRGAIEAELAMSPLHDETRKEFFAGLLAPAQKQLDSLANYPAPPKGKAAKAKWLADGKILLQQAKASNQILHDAWFKFKALDFEGMAEAGHQLFDFESRLRAVEAELSPQKKSPKGPAPRGIFEATDRVAGRIAKNGNPVGAAIESAVLPMAITVDMIDLLTRPLVWMDGIKKQASSVK